MSADRALLVLFIAAAVAVLLAALGWIVWASTRGRKGSAAPVATDPSLDRARADLARQAANLQPSPAIGPARLASLMDYAGVFVGKPSRVLTAEQLRRELLAQGRLTALQRFEVPAVDAVDTTLSRMATGHGRYQVEAVGWLSTGRAWRITRKQPEGGR